MLTGARLAAQRGADGMFLFNMPYYRSANQDDPEKWAVPPFDIMGCLDPASMNSSGCIDHFEPAHHFLAASPNIEAQELAGRYPLPLDLPSARKRPLEFYVVVPPQGWPDKLRLAVEFEMDPGSDASVDIWVNGNHIGAGAPEPDPNPFTPAPFTWIERTEVPQADPRRYELSSNGELRCATVAESKKLYYLVRKEYLREGANTFVFKRRGSEHRLQSEERMQRVHAIDLMPRFAQ